MNRVYIELVFLDNFIINGLIIWLASVLTKSQKKWGRFAAAAALGGVYACFAAVFGGALAALPAKTAAAAVMCVTAFYERGGRNLLRNACAFYAAAFVIAGAVYAAAFSSGNTSLTPLLRYILIGVCAGTVLIAILSHIRQRALMYARQIVCLRLTYGPRSTTVRAYVDTGNLLTAPMSSVGVVFVTKAVAAALFDKSALALLAGHTAAATDRLRIVAASTASGGGLFYGILIDDIALEKEASGTRAVVCIARTAFAQGCGAIVGPAVMDILTKGEHHDHTPDTKDGSMDSHTLADCAEYALHQRERGTAAAADPAGGSGISAGAGRRGQVGTARAHRAEP